MSLQPLTSAGVQAKLNELYALTDAQLLAQANLIRSNFVSWIQDNFTLTQAQSSYLSTIDPLWMQTASATTATAVQFRLPVTYTPDTPPPSFISKMVHHTININSVFDSQQGFTASGSMNFHISYS